MMHSSFRSILCRLTYLLTLLVIIAQPTLCAADSVRPHPRVVGDTASPDYSLSVNGKEVPVVDWFGEYAYAHFSCAPVDKVTLKLTASEAVESYSIRPLREEIEAQVGGTGLTFGFSGRKYLSVQVNGLARLFIFADPIETDPVRASNAGVVNIANYVSVADGSVVSTEAINKAIADVSRDDSKSILYFGPGEYRSGTIILQSGVTLYLDEGALLKASNDPRDFDRDHPGGPYQRLNFITAYKADNVAICGRGVIDGNASYLRPLLGSELPGMRVERRVPNVDANRIVNLQFSHCENVLVEGVFSRNSSSWNTVPHYCDDATFKNYKVLSDMVWKGYKNDDAIDPDSCVNLLIEDSFFAARDDGIVLKTTGQFKGNVSPDGTSSDMHGVMVRNNVIFVETAAMKYGQNESEESKVHDITFKNNVVLQGREGVQIDHSGPAQVFGLRFEGNHYEDIRRFSGKRPAQNYLLSHRTLRDLQFTDEWHENIAEGGSVVEAENVIFRNLVMQGNMIGTPEAGHFEIKGKNITFIVPMHLVTVGYILLGAFLLLMAFIGWTFGWRARTPQTTSKAAIPSPDTSQG